MNNPLHILQTLDRHLTTAAELTLFGRAALCLGYPDSPAEFQRTRDVDGILSLEWLAAPDENVDFWLAQQAANLELHPQASISRTCFAKWKSSCNRIGAPDACA